MMKKLLFVDDDTDFLESNRLYFSRKGYDVSCADCAKNAMKVLTSMRIDCIILDIDMPDATGFELCEKLRKVTGSPVIFISGYSDIKNRIQSFRCGGDDFMAKPYDIVELELRIEARIRKNEQVFFTEQITYGDLIIDTQRQIIEYKGKQGNFSALQFDIIAFMARNPDKVFSYEQLYEQVWKEPIVKSRHNLQVAIATIRQKLSQLCEGKQYIRTISRKGYFFTDKDED